MSRRKSNERTGAILLAGILWLSGCGAAGGSSAGGGFSSQFDIAPQVEFASSGFIGGPFAPSSRLYTLSNHGTTNFDWTSSTPAAWLTLDLTSGSLLPGDSVDVTVSIDQVFAASLGAGVYTTSILFQDALANGVTLDAELTVSDPPVVPPAQMTSATRTIGIAPLLVVFDAVNTLAPIWSSGVVQPVDGDFAKFHYEWDYGEAAAGTWPVNSVSRDVDTGFIAGHVYEQPGVYHVNLRVLTSADQEFFYTQDIAVQPFSGTTYYVSSSTGNNTNPGTNPAAPLASFDAGIAKSATNVRILFKRGEMFSTLGFRSITANGPGILGAYGSGANPVVSISSGTNDNNLLVVSADDWRICDLKFIGAGRGIDTSAALGFVYETTNRNFLALRVEATEFRTGLGWVDAAPGQSHDACGVVDSYVHHNEINDVYVGAKHLAILGNRFERPNDSHILRVWQANKAVISHNLLDTPGGDRHCLKLHGYPEGEPRLKSEYIQIADNEMHGIGTWTVAIGPQNTMVDERVRHLVFERNRSYNSGIDVVVRGRNITVRNNIFDGTSPGAYYTGVEVLTPGIEPSSDMVGIYNNTVYTAGTHQEIALARVDPSASNTIVENNIICAPNASVPVILVDTTPSDGINNIVVSASDFVNALAGNFQLVAGAAAVDVGNALKQVREDFARAVRPSTQDLGALER